MLLVPLYKPDTWKDMYPRMPHKDYGKTVQQMPTRGKPTEGGRTDL